MARPLRIEFENAFYHITSRGNEKNKIFAKDCDRKEFLDIINNLCEKYKFIIYAYVLMGNHYHFLLETLLPNLSKIMRDLNGNYTQYFNRTYNRVGHLFQGRYKAILVDKDNYLLFLSRYIHLNPVKANIVKVPENYEWSSLKYFLTDIKVPVWLNIKYILNYFNNFKEYKEFICKGINETINPFQNLYHQTILGEEAFIKNVVREKINAENKTNKEVSYYEKIKKIITPEEILNIILKYFDIDKNGLKRAKIKDNLPKKCYIYFTRKYTSYSLKDMTEELGNMTYSAVAKSYNRIEEKIKKNYKLKKIVDELDSKINKDMSQVKT